MSTYVILDLYYKIHNMLLMKLVISRQNHYIYIYIYVYICNDFVLKLPISLKAYYEFIYTYIYYIYINTHKHICAVFSLFIA